MKKLTSGLGPSHFLHRLTLLPVSAAPSGCPLPVKGLTIFLNPHLSGAHILLVSGTIQLIFLSGPDARGAGNPGGTWVTR